MVNPDIWKHGFGQRPKEFDDKARAKSHYKKPRVWTDEKIAEFIDDMLTLYKKILMEEKKINTGGAKLKSETIRDMNNMINRLLQYKDKYYPTIQKNINVNIDITADAVMERLREWKKKKQVVEIV